MSMDNKLEEVVWPWRAGEKGEQKRRLSAGRVMVHSLLVAAIGGGVCALLGHWKWGAIPVGLGLFLLVSGFLFPVVFLAVEKAGQKLGDWVGVILTWGLLTPFFYLCFVPLRLGALLRKKDPLGFVCPTNAPSYWVPHPGTSDASSYRKQF